MIYVDPLYPTPRTAEWPHDEAAHLFCLPGQVEVLREFATLMELGRKLRNDGILPHFELNREEHELAVEAGARQVTREGLEEAIRIWRRYRCERPIKTDRRRTRP